MNYTGDDGQWCKVEIMGHVEHIARVKEVPLLDGKALRVCDETEPDPIFYGLGAIFSLRWLSEEEGTRLAGERAAVRASREERRAYGAKIGAIQDTIRKAIHDRKMTLVDLRAAVLAVTPEVSDADFVEAFRDLGLDEIRDVGPERVTLYWFDSDSTPF